MIQEHVLSMPWDILSDGMIKLFPRDPITLSDDDWGVQSPPQQDIFSFHYHSQKVIGSL